MIKKSFRSFVVRSDGPKMGAAVVLQAPCNSSVLGVIEFSNHLIAAFDGVPRSFGSGITGLKGLRAWLAGRPVGYVVHFDAARGRIY